MCRLVRDWLQQQALSFEPIAAWCHETAGHCDCHVLVNSHQHWWDVRHDVDW